MNATALQFPLRPVRQCAHSPQEIWKGTLTSSPGWGEVTASPTSSTSATHSWPIGNGGGNGEPPPMMGASRSHVATASGRTSAARSDDSRGSGASRQASSAGAV